MMCDGVIVCVCNVREQLQCLDRLSLVGGPFDFILVLLLYCLLLLT